MKIFTSDMPMANVIYYDIYYHYALDSSIPSCYLIHTIGTYQKGGDKG